MSPQTKITLNLDRSLLEHPSALHLKRMRNGLWLYLDLLARLPASGEALHVDPKTVAHDMGLPEGTVRSWLGHLRRHGYLRVENQSNGVRIALPAGEAAVSAPRDPSANRPPAVSEQVRLFTARRLASSLGNPATKTPSRPRSTSTATRSSGGPWPAPWLLRPTRSADRGPRSFSISSSVTPMKARTLLALDPGLRDLGYAVIKGRRIAAAGVIPLRFVSRARRPREARAAVRELAILHRPQELVVEQTHSYPNGLHLLIRALKRIAQREHMLFALYSPQAVRKGLVGNGWATKKEVAAAVAAKYPAFRVYLTQDRKWKALYWQNMFDAIAVGLHHRAQS